MILNKDLNYKELYRKYKDSIRWLLVSDRFIAHHGVRAEFLARFLTSFKGIYNNYRILQGVFYKSSFSNIFILDLETFIHLLWL